jgi:drug/metabolite transporter (DMT)-like permease
LSAIDRNTLLHILLLLLLAAVMGGIFPLIKVAEQDITPLTLAMLRAVLAAIVLLFIVGIVMKRDLAPLISRWQAYATLGLMLSTFFVSIPEAEERIPANLSSLLTCIIPISTFLIATLILRWDRFTLTGLSGSVIALAGVAMFIGLERIQFGHSQLIGIGIIAVGYIIYAIYLIYSRACDFDPFVATTGTMVYVSLILCVAAFSLEQPLELRPGKDAVLATLAIGILSTGLGYAVLNYLIANAGVIFAATSGYFIPVFAILMGYFLVEEPITSLQVVGLGMTLVGARLVNRQPAPSS